MKKTMFAMLMAGTLCMGMTFAGTALAQDAGSEDSGDSLSSLLGSILGEDSDLSSLLGEGGELENLLGEGGDLSSLLGEGGPVSDLIGSVGQYLPEDLDIGSLVSGIGEQLQDSDSELYQSIEGLAGALMDENGNLDVNGLKDLAGTFLGSSEGLDEEDMAELEDVFPFELRDIITEYVRERNSEVMDSADVQSVTPVITGFEKAEDGTYMVLGYFLQTNFKKEGTDLTMAAAAGDTLLLTLTPNEESGEYEVTDCEAAEDGEGYADSVAAMSEKIGKTAEDYFTTTMATVDMVDISMLMEVLNENPDMERIEYAGEMRTAQELEDALIEQLDSALSMAFETEDMTEGLTE